VHNNIVIVYEYILQSSSCSQNT